MVRNYPKAWDLTVNEITEVLIPLKATAWWVHSLAKRFNLVSTHKMSIRWSRRDLGLRNSISGK